ncbi:MAG: hypothetical protein Q8R83_04255 [Legionellaceae bacterium]|nr:hypothetical protein [Legionellaceae bacterium]
MSYEAYAKQITQIKPAAPVFVAFLDILGFSDFVKNNSHAEVVKIYQAVFRSIIDMTLTETAEQLLPESQWLKDITNPNNHDLSPKLDNVSINVLSISDSIILSTTDDEFKNLIKLIATVRNIMARTLYFGFPLRGAITHGMLTLDSQESFGQSKIIHHQMFGLPIVEAAELEKIQHWSGCVIHENVALHIGYKLRGLDYTMLVPYEIPLKDKTPELMLAVNWVYTFLESDQKDINSQRIKDSFASHRKTTNNATVLIDNTIKFFEAMKHYTSIVTEDI